MNRKFSVLVCIVWFLTIFLCWLDVKYSLNFLFLPTEAHFISVKETNLYLRDPEGGGRQRNVLTGIAAYKTNGSMLSVPFQITDDFWVSGGKYAELKTHILNKINNRGQILVFKLYPSKFWFVKEQLLVPFFIGSFIFLILMIFYEGVSMLKNSPPRNTNVIIK